MKHLDALFDELQYPIEQLMDWCDEDQDRAIVACWKDMTEAQKIEAIERMYWDVAVDIESIIEDINEEILRAESENEKPELNYVNLYLPLEVIINDRIDMYNQV